MKIGEGGLGKLERYKRAALWVGIAIVVALAVLVAVYGSSLESLAGFGYPGVAVLMFLTSTTVFLPAPGFAAVMAAGTVWNPLLVGIFAGIGAATGEMSGYILGAGCRNAARLDANVTFLTAQRWLNRYGIAAILILSLVPNPFFDVLGLAAGAMGYPARRFWIVCIVGKAVKFVTFAYFGKAIWD
jgi:membrane protein YqaA with SNARE-associated domain